MAWPNTPLTTYTFDGAPPIKSMDLNAIQDAINRIINGTYSLRAVTIDGTGGNIVAPVAGSLTVSGTTIFNGDLTIATGHTLNTDSVTFTGGSTGYPTDATSINNLAINGNQCKAWGVAGFATIGNSFDSIGCQISYMAAATSFDVTLNDAMTSSFYSIVSGVGSPNVVLLKTTSITANSFTISLRDITNTPVVPGNGTTVSFAVFGRQT